MQNTINYNLKKPDYTDFADIADINDNMDTIDAQLAAPTGDSADSTTTFTTSDTADGSASSWTNVPALTSGETHKSLFAKMSQMFKNIRYLYKMLGTTDISSIGNGTVTNALSVLNAKLVNSNFLNFKGFGYSNIYYITLTDIPSTGYYGPVCIFASGKSYVYNLTGYDSTETDASGTVKTYKHALSNGMYDFQIVFPEHYTHCTMILSGIIANNTRIVTGT